MTQENNKGGTTSYQLALLQQGHLVLDSTLARFHSLRSTAKVWRSRQPANGKPTHTHSSGKQRSPTCTRRCSDARSWLSVDSTSPALCGHSTMTSEPCTAPCQRSNTTPADGAGMQTAPDSALLPCPQSPAGETAQGINEKKCQRNRVSRTCKCFCSALFS